LFLFVGAVASDEPPAPSSSPEARLADLGDSAQRAMGEAKTAVYAAKSEKEIDKIIERVTADLAALHRHALDLAAKHSTAPVAVKALAWVAEMRPPGQQSPEIARALTALRRDHTHSDQIAGLCQSLERLDSPESEAFLRGVAAENPSRALQARALATLAVLLRNRGDARYNDDPRESERCAQEAERTLTKVASDFGDLKATDSSTFADWARGVRDEMHRLSAGKTAPAIEGTDVDGKKFKLSDYKGKVVVVDFWAGWCVACMAEVPHGRSLAARLRDKPFALLGVNCDETRQRQKEVEQKHGITWRSWYDGPLDGPIWKQYGTGGLPSVYVIDGRGVIRYKGIGGKELDTAVDRLLKETAATASP
jgi:peroxiredoxin